MSKYHFFIGLLVAAFILPNPVGLGSASGCLITEIGTDHGCCSGQAEPAPMSCCSEESSPDPAPAVCTCSHAPDSPAGPLPVVPANAPSVVVEMVEVDVVAGERAVANGSPAEAWRHGPLGTSVPVFLLDCAFLI